MENILSLFLITGESVSNTFSVILGIYFSEFKPEASFDLLQHHFL